MSLLLLFTGARRRRWFPAPGEAGAKKKKKVNAKEQILIEDNEILELITILLESDIL